jgi:putative ABC transport system substrate-binding protein
MRRRQFITLLGGAAAGWPLVVRAQQADRVRRIGVMMALLEHDPEARTRIRMFQDALQQAGWSVNGNVRIDYRFNAGDRDVARKQAMELVALGPDVILAHASTALLSLKQATRSIPIVFVQVIDPVGNAFVESLERPGGNITGFSSFEYSIAGNWLELLKAVAPRVTRVAVIRDAALPAGVGQMAAAQAVAQSTGVELQPIGMRNMAEIERGIGALAREPNGGLIVTASSAAAIHRRRIIVLAARHRLPAIYFYRYFIKVGGLISYGPDLHDQYRRAAGYVDRILKGEKPADLPVQAPTKYELVINLKTAKALGLEVPDRLLVAADEVIE